MLTHDAVWNALDELARKNRLSVSGLARNSGLDPTSFNRSKRHTADGRKRWPSTESVSKALKATNTSIGEFLSLIDPASRNADRSMKQMESFPLIGFAEAGTGGYFDDSGFPAGEGWEEIDFPTGGSDAVYALQISGDSMLPLYRDGDVILVNPDSRIKRGDRVVVKTVEGEVMAKLLQRRNQETVELKSINPEHEDRKLPVEEIDWIARIVWASQ